MYNEVVDTLIKSKAKRVTKYVSPNEIVRAVRRSYSFGKNTLRKKKNIEINLTIGKPNYTERQFIKDCQRSGEPFPVKKIQIKH